MKETDITKRFKNIDKSTTFNNIVKIFSLDEKKVLDIGCSWGEFLVHFGPGSLGVTVSDDEAKWGREQGINILNCDIEDQAKDIPEKGFDAIFANNLFEHIESPHPFLINIKKFLKDDGILILGVPCVPRIISLVKIKKFRGSLGSAHINFFNWYTLQKTVERAGWQVEDNRGFRFRPKLIDNALRIIYPHFYVIAKLKPGFAYPGKRQKEVDWKKSALNNQT